jgi:hypothetical protein
MVRILQKDNTMTTKTIILSILISFGFFTAFYVYLGLDRQEKMVVTGKGKTSISPPPETKPEVLYDEPDEPLDSTRDSRHVSPLGEPPQQDSAVPSLEPKRSTSPSSKGPPTPPVQMEPPIEQTIPNPPPVVLPPEQALPVKLCGGKPISQCLDVQFTHVDFALLVMDILALGSTQDAEEAFRTLEFLNIQPIGGWEKSDPQKPITLREMEEVRCSLSLSAEKGLISVGPSVLTASVNRFCEELKVSLEAIESAGIGEDRRGTRPSETGYQGGVNVSPESPEGSVMSPPN